MTTTSHRSPTGPNNTIGCAPATMPTAIQLDHALGVVWLAEAAYSDALNSLRRALDDSPSAMLLADIVEAAVRAGQVDDAQRAARILTSQALLESEPLVCGLRSRVLAMLAGDDAEIHFLASIDTLAHAGPRSAIGRTLLLYGEWLGRRRRRTEARAALRRALEIFESETPSLFAGRARVELLATGAVERSQRPRRVDELTDRELQVASEAAQGRTNREIAERLCISPATVDYHLRKVFMKLQLNSRRQLQLDRRASAWVRDDQDDVIDEAAVA